MRFRFPRLPRLSIQAMTGLAGFANRLDPSHRSSAVGGLRPRIPYGASERIRPRVKVGVLPIRQRERLDQLFVYETKAAAFFFQAHALTGAGGAFESIEVNLGQRHHRSRVLMAPRGIACRGAARKAARQETENRDNEAEFHGAAGASSVALFGRSLRHGRYWLWGPFLK